MFYSYTPTKILNGIGAFDAIGRELDNVDDLVVIHGHSLALFDFFKVKLSQLVKSKRLEFICIPNVDPCVDDVLNVATQLGDRRPFLLGVGGGRVMDFTKALAVIQGNALLNPDSIFSSDHFTWKGALPLAVISTRPGSGSESNNAFILSESSKWKKSLFSLFTYPKFCIHDPVFFKTLDSNEYKFGLFDAVIHVLDQYVVDRDESLIVDELALSYLKILGRLAKSADSPSAKNFLELAWVGAMISSGVLTRGVNASWRCHELAHAFASLTNASHGISLVFLAPSVFQKFAPSNVRLEKAMLSLSDGLGSNIMPSLRMFVDVLFENNCIPDEFLKVDVDTFSSELVKHCAQYSSPVIEDILMDAINER